MKSKYTLPSQFPRGRAIGNIVLITGRDSFAVHIRYFGPKGRGAGPREHHWYVGTGMGLGFGLGLGSGLGLLLGFRV